MCFSNTARPLQKLCEKISRFNWTDDCLESFDHLKQALTTASVLAYPILGSSFILDTDSSDVSPGAVLSQSHK